MNRKIPSYKKDHRWLLRRGGGLRVLSGRFYRGVWLTLSSLSEVGAIEFNPPRYPKNMQALDLDAIGNDMYQAIERLNDEIKTTETSTTS